MDDFNHAPHSALVPGMGLTQTTVRIPAVLRTTPVETSATETPESTTRTPPTEVRLPTSILSPPSETQEAAPTPAPRSAGMTPLTSVATTRIQVPTTTVAAPPSAAQSAGLWGAGTHSPQTSSPPSVSRDEEEARLGLRIVSVETQGDGTYVVIQTTGGCYAIRVSANSRAVSDPESVTGARYVESLSDIVGWLTRTSDASASMFATSTPSPEDVHELMEQRVALGEARRLPDCVFTPQTLPQTHATRGMNPVALLVVAGIGFLLLRASR